MADKTVTVRLRAEIAAYQAGMKRAAASTAEFAREISGAGSTSTQNLERVGRGAALMAGGLAIGFGLAVKAAIDWETAWAGVTKTVDGSAAQMAELEDGLRKLASELPATHAEIAAVAEAAGALGVKREAIEGFTKTMIDLGETTDLTADQAATAMAQIANVMQTPQTEFDRMGATLVELGNNGASTESQILELANRLAAAGQIAGLSEADVFSFASTLASVGVEAEAGGTALSKVFTRVRDAVIDGGESLEIFARVAGVSAESFAAAFQADPAGAIESFISGLGRMNEAGMSTSAVFEDLELNDERLKRALLSTAGAGELLADQLDLGRQAWEDNTALQTEAEKRYATTAAQIEMLRNTVVDLGIDMGSTLLPVIRSTVDVLGQLALGFASLPDPVRNVLMGLSGAALAAFGMAAGAALLIPKIRALQIALIAMGRAGALAAAAMPWLAAAAAAIAAVTFVMGQSAKNAKAAEEAQKAFSDAIREAGSVTEGTRSRVADLAGENANFAELLDKSGTSVDQMTAALQGSDAEWKRFTDNLLAEAKAAGLSDEAITEAMLGLDPFRAAAQGGAEDAATLGRVLGETSTATSRASGGLSVVTGSMEDQAEAAKTAREEFQNLLDAYRASVDPLFGMLDALTANKEAIGAEAAARAQGAKDIADASETVAEAEQDLRDARGVPDNADGIAAAEERLADARERLDEVTADAAISAAEKAEFDRAAAESALELEIKARELAAAIADGTVPLAESKAMLEEWVAQGSLTEEQAANMAVQFDIAAAAAEGLAGPWVASVYMMGVEEVKAQIADLMTRLLGLQALGLGMGIDALQTESQIIRRSGRPKAAAGGGRFGMGEYGWVGEQGPELVRFGGPAQVYPHRESMAMAGSFSPAGSTAGGGSWDHSRSSTFDIKQTIVTADPRRAAADAGHRLRKVALEVDA